MKTKFTTKFLMGEVDGEKIYLSAPSWDCDWYWGMGYIGNKNCHYHLDGLTKTHNTDLCSAIRKEFGDSLTITDESDQWKFAELIQTAYNLRLTAEVLGRGGSHLTTNPCASIIMNKDEAKRINEKVLPAIFDAVEDILTKYK